MFVFSGGKRHCVIVGLVTVLLLTHAADACIFYKSHGHVFTEALVTHSETVTNFATGCEILCYYAGCDAANVKPLPLGNYLCEFVNLSVQTRYRQVLTPVRGAKYLSRNNVQSTFRNIASGSSCTASSHNPNAGFGCDKATDGVPNSEWATQGTNLGSWIRLGFGSSYTVVEVELFQRCSSHVNDLLSEASVTLGTPLVSLVADDIDCTVRVGCTGAAGRSYPVPKMVTSFLTVTITKVCAPNGSNGLAEVVVRAL